jgi:hypothetical protein
LANSATVFANKKIAWPLVYHIEQPRQALGIMFDNTPQRFCSFCVLLPIRKAMSFFERSLVRKQIHSVHVDSEVTCLMLTDGTQVTIRGWVVVELGAASHTLGLPTLAGVPEATVRVVKGSPPA